MFDSILYVSAGVILMLITNITMPVLNTLIAVASYGIFTTLTVVISSHHTPKEVN
ncbi:hypothetical protein FWD07_00100 [Candidatus Saccharibacteria bacterium]|nr:hypothetical protein [Candidatus Saccharibacteria bacterium]